MVEVCCGMCDQLIRVFLDWLTAAGEVVGITIVDHWFQLVWCFSFLHFLASLIKSIFFETWEASQAKFSIDKRQMGRLKRTCSGMAPRVPAQFSR